MTTAISTAMASKNEASTPTARSSSQLRKICANTATSTKPNTLLPPSRERSTARPAHSLRPSRRARWRNPVLRAATTANATIGSHQGSPSGATSVKEVSAASIASIVRIGNSAAISVGTWGQTSGDERRSAAIRAATPR